MSRQRHRRSASDRSRSAVALWPMLSDAAPPQAAASTLSRSNDGLAIANPQRVSECAPRTAASSATAALLLPQTAAMSRAATPPRLPRPPAADPPFQIRLSPELKRNERSYIFLLVLSGGQSDCTLSYGAALRFYVCMYVCVCMYVYIHTYITVLTVWVRLFMIVYRNLRTIALRYRARPCARASWSCAGASKSPKYPRSEAKYIYDTRHVRGLAVNVNRAVFMTCQTKYGHFFDQTLFRPF